MDWRHGPVPSVQRALGSQHRRHLICRPARSSTARPSRSRPGSAAAPPTYGYSAEEREGARAAIPAASEGRGRRTQFADRAVALAYAGRLGEAEDLLISAYNRVVDQLEAESRATLTHRLAVFHLEQGLVPSAPHRPHNPAARSCRYPGSPRTTSTGLRPAGASASSPSRAPHCCLRPRSITRRPSPRLPA